MGLQHVYIPVLFYAGVDYIDAPTPYLMGLHSAVDTTDLTMDGVCFFAVLFLSQLTFLSVVTVCHIFKVLMLLLGGGGEPRQ